MKPKKVNLISGEWYLAKSKSKNTFVILIEENTEKCLLPYSNIPRDTKGLTIVRKITKEEAKKIIEKEIRELKFAEGFTADAEDQLIKGFLVAYTMKFLKNNF